VGRAAHLQQALNVTPRPDAPPAQAVPLLDLSRQWPEFRDEALAAIIRVCDSQQFILGDEVDAFERESAALIGVRHAIGVSSGTDALLVALMALDLGPDDEVITSTYSFFATAGSIVRAGARPVLVDIDPVTYNLDPEAVRAAVTPRTRAIMPVHLYGQCADMDALESIAGAAGVPIIEDAAQAIGSAINGRAAGSIGLAGCFSFFPSKNLGAFGDAGLVTTNDDAFAERVRLLRVHGAERQYHHRLIGGNFRIDALQAAVLRVKAPRLAQWTEGRRRNARRYRELFEERGLAGRIGLPEERSGRFHIYNQYVVRLPARDRVKQRLAARNVGTAVYYPVPFHRQECFAFLNPPRDAFPHADAAARETLALPIFAELTEEELAHVVSSLAGALDETGA
jgi:dTDP-4-amino-4,6-dideoxygalactose transaminase